MTIEDTSFKIVERDSFKIGETIGEDVDSGQNELQRLAESINVLTKIATDDTVLGGSCALSAHDHTGSSSGPIIPFTSGGILGRVIQPYVCGYYSDPGAGTVYEDQNVIVGPVNWTSDDSTTTTIVKDNPFYYDILNGSSQAGQFGVTTYWPVYDERIRLLNVPEIPNGAYSVNSAYHDDVGTTYNKLFGIITLDSSYDSLILGKKFHYIISNDASYPHRLIALPICLSTSLETRVVTVGVVPDDSPFSTNKIRIVEAGNHTFLNQNGFSVYIPSWASKLVLRFACCATEYLLIGAAASARNSISDSEAGPGTPTHEVYLLDTASTNEGPKVSINRSQTNNPVFSDFRWHQVEIDVSSWQDTTRTFELKVTFPTTRLANPEGYNYFDGNRSNYDGTDDRYRLPMLWFHQPNNDMHRPYIYGGFTI